MEDIKLEIEELIELLNNVDTDINFKRQELYGYTSTIPEYRIILREIRVNDNEKDEIFNEPEFLSPPSIFPESLYFDNLREIHIGNGLINLVEILDSFLIVDLHAVEIKILESLFDSQLEGYKPQFIITNNQVREMIYAIKKQIINLSKK